jgi:aquaporin Z
MRAYVTEFIGTFFLVLTVGLSVSNGTPLAPLAIGASLMIMVYMGGHISGGHYNPAVSLAVALRGKLSWGNFIPYLIAQFCAAIAAGLATLAITQHTVAPAPGPTATTQGALLVEFFYTFALALVVLNSATTEKTQGNSYFGLAIGFTVVVGAFAGGGVSGGAFNPAVGFGLVLVNAMHNSFAAGTMKYVWLYLVGPFSGGAVAAAVYLYQNSPPALRETNKTR